IHVPADYATIQEAIDHAIDSDTILVAPGNYDLSAGIWNDRVNNLILMGSREEDGNNASIINAAVNPGTYVAIKFFGVTGCTIAGFEVKNAHSGISLENCQNCRITRNYIHDNDEANGCHGDGIEIFHCENIDVTLNIIDHNEFHGIELQYTTKNINIRDNTILQTSGNDGIVLYDYAENVTIKNNIIGYSNEEGIELVYLDPDSPINFVNDYNCFWQNGAGPIRSPFAIGPHSVLADPLLVDMANQNYYLKPGSPCLGAGENGANIGALGRSITEVSKAESQLPITFEMSQNYPNPFNAETRINYQLPEHSQVTIKIYNSLGREIRTLAKADKAAGYYTIHWDGKDNSGNQVVSGIYLYQIKARNFNCTKKLAVLK
ncbi:MAG: right-handed parallel beta-helix repeat-containing protein, partial [bacterium]|nr:right-handed parallel beta-helix repeat-containing protein [bacterium]